MTLPTAPPLSTNYGEVGTAFDYLLRFRIKRENPKSKDATWIAENSLKLVPQKKFNYLRKNFDQTRKEYERYIKNGKITDELLKSCLSLAKIDKIFRSGTVPTKEEFHNINYEDIEDLKKLYRLCQRLSFRNKKICLLNPTFGKASGIVGGADADLVLDDTLIDIKTTKRRELTEKQFHQLVGYYCLYKIGGIDGAPRNHKIRKLGIYFSRFGELFIINVKDVINNERKFGVFLKWLEKTAGDITNQQIISSIIMPLKKEREKQTTLKRYIR